MSTLRLGRGLTANALSAAVDWLIEPADPCRSADHPPQVEARPVVAVLGLSPGCGATTVARALGAQLASRDPSGVCAVSSAVVSRATPLGLPAAARLARELAPLAAGGTSACGRLCLIEGADRAAVAAALRYVAPFVIDVDTRTGPSVAAASADHMVLVGSPVTEPALSAVMVESLQGVGPDPVTVLNRAGPDCERWACRAAIELPESRMGAWMALAGHDPRGSFGRAVAKLTAVCEGVR